MPPTVSSQVQALGEWKSLNMTFMVTFLAIRVSRLHLLCSILLTWFILLLDRSSALNKRHLHLMNAHLLRFYDKPGAVSYCQGSMNRET